MVKIGRERRRQPMGRELWGGPIRKFIELCVVCVGEAGRRERERGREYAHTHTKLIYFFKTHTHIDTYISTLMRAFCLCSHISKECVCVMWWWELERDEYNISIFNIISMISLVVVVCRWFMFSRTIKTIKQKMYVKVVAVIIIIFLLLKLFLLYE